MPRNDAVCSSIDDKYTVHPFPPLTVTSIAIHAREALCIRTPRCSSTIPSLASHLSNKPTAASILPPPIRATITTPYYTTNSATPPSAQDQRPHPTAKLTFDMPSLNPIAHLLTLPPVLALALVVYALLDRTCPSFLSSIYVAAAITEIRPLDVFLIYVLETWMLALGLTMV